MLERMIAGERVRGEKAKVWRCREASAGQTSSTHASEYVAVRSLRRCGPMISPGALGGPASSMFRAWEAWAMQAGAPMTLAVAAKATPVEVSLSFHLALIST